MNLRNYLEKFRVQDTNENEYVWKYDETMETPTFEYVANQPFRWNEKGMIDHATEIPLVPNYLDPKVKCFTHKPQLDKGIMIDSIDFYFYVEKLASIEKGMVYIYVHEREQLIRNMRYLYKIRNFIGINSKNSNNQLVFDLMYLRVVKSRKDAKDTCDVNLANDDLKWMKHVVLPSDRTQNQKNAAQ